ncbi:MAG: sensor histidine kinase [Roseiflexaceae bacterium]|nr:sensor histidine kinase [Roseiflexaceae bacterium]
MTATEAHSQLEALRTSANADLDKSRRELAELETLLRQTTTEVEKLAQREMTVANRLRDLEVNIDKYNKADIRNFYVSAQEVQMRLLMMRSQLEQLQFRQQMLKARQSQQLEVITTLEALGPLGGTSGGAATRSDENNAIANIIQAQENERLRMSMQMHDGPAQSLSNLVLRAEICQKMFDRDAEMARAELSGLKTAINTTLQDIRRFIFDLRPMTLDDLGLVPTLRRYMQQFQEKNKVEVNIMAATLDQRLPPHYEIAIFRFVQEALNNVAKHANATQARVIIDNTGNSIHVAVEDDGSGFPLSEVLSENSGRRNLGIATMRQQAEALMNGEFGIESAIGRGTRVAAVIPVP